MIKSRCYLDRSGGTSFLKRTTASDRPARQVLTQRHDDIRTFRKKNREHTSKSYYFCKSVVLGIASWSVDPPGSLSKLGIMDIR